MLKCLMYIFFAGFGLITLWRVFISIWTFLIIQWLNQLTFMWIIVWSWLIWLIVEPPASSNFTSLHVLVSHGFKQTAKSTSYSFPSTIFPMTQAAVRFERRFTDFASLVHSSSSCFFFPPQASYVLCFPPFCPSLSLEPCTVKTSWTSSSSPLSKAWTLTPRTTTSTQSLSQAVSPSRGRTRYCSLKWRHPWNPTAMTSHRNVW